MDIALLVKFLAPCLPFLTGLGQKVVDKGAEKLGEQGAAELLPQAKKIWGKLRPKVQAKAAEDVAKDPENSDALEALEQQLKKILEAPEHATLAAEIEEILAETETENFLAGAVKYNVHVKDSQVGSIGDRATVTMNIGSKLHE